MTAMQRNKGARVERDIVNRHKALGVHAERVPISGASTYTHPYDVDVYPFGLCFEPMVAEVKAEQRAIPKTIIKQLGEADLLFMKPDRQDPYVFMPWATWARILERLKA